MQIPNIRNIVTSPVNYFVQSSWQGKTVQVLFATSILLLIYYVAFRNKTPPADGAIPTNRTPKSGVQKKEQANQTQAGQPTTYTPEEFKKLLDENYQFPPHVIVNGGLIFKNPKVKMLPPNLTVKGQLHIVDCKELKALPRGLKVEGPINLSQCTSLTTIPEDLEVVQGSVDLSDCTSLKTLPSGLKVEFGLTLRNTGLTTLPEDLEVGWNLDLSGCIHLKQLSQRPPKFGSTIHLEGCTGLTSLPAWITTLGSTRPRIINLKNTDLSEAAIEELRQTPAPGVRFFFPYRKVDPSITFTPSEFKRLLLQNHQFPPNAMVTGNLDLQNSNIQTLPIGLEVRGSLDLSNCSALTALPEGLEVQDNLTLLRCTGLTALPERLKVGYHLNLSYTSITSLPQRPLEIGNKLHLDGCAALTSLPDWITTLGDGIGYDMQFTCRWINLENTGLSNDIIERLRDLNFRAVSNVRYFVSYRATVPTIRFSNMDKALAFWLKEAKDETLTIPNIVIDREPDRANVIDFLARLTTTAEYQNLQTRTHLAGRILEVFNQIAQDEALKGAACELIHEGLTTCDDRIISALEEIELMLLLNKIENSNHTAEELKKLGKSFLLLEMVNAKAKAHKETLSWVDEIEIYLAFQIGLADRFNLPVKTRNMFFRGCAQVTTDQLQAFGDEIEQACTDEKLEAFLKTWSPWIKFQKQAQVIPAYDDLPVTDRELADDDTCAITLCDPEQPVLYNGRVYDYESFACQYRTNDTDPIDRSKIDISQLKRIIKKQ